MKLYKETPSPVLCVSWNLPNILKYWRCSASRIRRLHLLHIGGHLDHYHSKIGPWVTKYCYKVDSTHQCVSTASPNPSASGVTVSAGLLRWPSLRGCWARIYPTLNSEKTPKTYIWKNIINYWPLHEERGGMHRQYTVLSPVLETTNPARCEVASHRVWWGK